MWSKAIFLFAISTLLPSLITAQFTLDCCRTQSDCASPRQCEFAGGFMPPFERRPCEPEDEECRCAIGPTGFIVDCAFDDECLEGDTCQDTGGISSCLSQNEATTCGQQQPDQSSASAEPSPSSASAPTVTPTPSKKTPEPLKTPEPSTAPEPSEEPTTTPVPADKGTGEGLTRDSCKTTSDCKSPRQCTALNTAFEECEPGDVCQCIPEEPPRCETNDDCDEGEECFDGSDGRPGADPSKMCVSTCSILKTEDPEKFESMCESDSASPASTSDSDSPPTSASQQSPTPEPTEAICVAAEELEGVEKVFERDLHAWVLCDSGGSCATPGHMVVWEGRGMMMRSYCDAVGCEKKVMPVNSPRWKAGGVRAKTDGLVYTSFAARFETSFEERVLSAVVRLAL